MRGISVSITRLVDSDHTPGWVECRFVDAGGLEHVFVEKVPVVASEEFHFGMVLPQPGVIGCTVVGESSPDSDVVVVDTDAPWGIESKEGKTRFEVRRSDLVDIPKPGGDAA